MQCAGPFSLEREVMACTSPGRSLNHLHRLKSHRYKWNNVRSDQGDSVGQRSRRCGSGDGSSALVRRGDHTRAHSLRRGRHSWKVAIGEEQRALTRTPTGWRLSLGFPAFRAVGNKCVSYTPPPPGHDILLQQLPEKRKSCFDPCPQDT